MQSLIFEAAWDKTISDRDRKKIESVFEELDHNGEGLQTTFLQQAVNHRGKLLYMVLLHNYMDTDCSFQHKTATLTDKDGKSISETFSVPVKIPAHTSMPWTFIFPKKAVLMDVDEAVLSF